MSLTPETEVSAAAVRPPADDESTEPDTLLVKSHRGVAASEKSTAHEQNGGRVTSVIPGIDVQVVAVEGGRGSEKAQAYAKNPNVLYAEPDHQAQAIGRVSDPQYGKQWGLPMVQAPIAWDVTKGIPSHLHRHPGYGNRLQTSGSRQRSNCVRLLEFKPKRQRHLRPRYICSRDGGRLDK